MKRVLGRTRYAGLVLTPAAALLLIGCSDVTTPLIAAPAAESADGSSTPRPTRAQQATRRHNAQRAGITRARAMTVPTRTATS